MLEAANLIEMGKNADESAGGTTNSMEPLPIKMPKYYMDSKCQKKNKDADIKLFILLYLPAVGMINKKNRPLQ